MLSGDVSFVIFIFHHKQTENTITMYLSIIKSSTKLQMFDIVSISHNIWKLLLLDRRGVGVRGGGAAQ